MKFSMNISLSDDASQNQGFLFLLKSDCIFFSLSPVKLKVSESIYKKSLPWASLVVIEETKQSIIFQTVL